jgi:hypothetical protein
MPNQRIFFLEDMLRELRKACQKPFENEPETGELKAIDKRIVEIRTAVRQKYEELKKEEERRVEADLR